jgi:hypothetical protein
VAGVRISAAVEVSGSLEPRRQKLFDVAAAPRIWQPGLSTLVGDDDQCWDRLDPEPLHELGPLIGVDVNDLEGLVVRASLKYLGHETFDPATTPRRCRMEEEKARLGGYVS